MDLSMVLTRIRFVVLQTAPLEAKFDFNRNTKITSAHVTASALHNVIHAYTLPRNSNLLTAYHRILASAAISIFSCKSNFNIHTKNVRE